MRVTGIKTMEEANAFLQSYIVLHNSRFAVETADNTKAFLPCPEPWKLNLVLGCREERKAGADSEISWRSYKYQLIDDSGRTILLRRGERIIVIQARDGTPHGIREEEDRDGIYSLTLSPLQNREKREKEKKEPVKSKAAKPAKPAADRLWRQSWESLPAMRYSHEDLDTMELFDENLLIIGVIKVS
jgi:hypothetical protein